MLNSRFLLALLTAALLASQASTAFAGGPHVRAERIAYYHAQQRPWHGPYSNTQYGLPVALVVPPTAHMHSAYSWGVAQTDMRPIYHKFGRNYQGGDGSEVDVYGNNFRPTPVWPSHTDQFGVYYVRGPY